MKALNLLPQSDTTNKISCLNEFRMPIGSFFSFCIFFSYMAYYIGYLIQALFKRKEERNIKEPRKEWLRRYRRNPKGSAIGDGSGVRGSERDYAFEILQEEKLYLCDTFDFIKRLNLVEI